MGGLAAIAKEPIGCLPLIIGILIVCYQDGIEATGEALVEWGFEFMQSVNMFGWGLGIFVNYWDVLLLIFFAPMALFLAVALVVITINMILNGIEFVVTRIYSIRRPCPICGSTDVPDYIIGGKPHPVKLHPGIYGVFTHTSPVTGKEIPTMLMNGRGKITRKCKKCNSFINADTESTIGTEIHIGIVGHRSSGKSYLLFSGLAALMRAYPDRLSQIDADSDTKIEIKKKRIDARDGIQTNVANKYRAIQPIGGTPDGDNSMFNKIQRLNNSFKPNKYELTEEAKELLVDFMPRHMVNKNNGTVNWNANLSEVCESVSYNTAAQHIYVKLSNVDIISILRTVYGNKEDDSYVEYEMNIIKQVGTSSTCPNMLINIARLNVNETQKIATDIGIQPAVNQVFMLR